MDCLFSILQAARQHKVRKGYGDSGDSYGGEFKDGLTMHGICQGNGTGPSIWAVLSSPILNLMRSKESGILFTSAISETKIRFTGYAFVVETDLCQIISALEKFGYAVVSLQQVVDTWEAGLKVSGGALAPEKTFW
jgi:hypothetical protein